MDLVYSPDDRGWYWERHDWATSQVWHTREEAIHARDNGNIIWDEYAWRVPVEDGPCEGES